MMCKVGSWHRIEFRWNETRNASTMGCTITVKNDVAGTVCDERDCCCLAEPRFAETQNIVRVQ